jgi:hypothetical protein
MYYTGVGSRETPANFLLLFKKLAQEFAKQKITLRTGGADGADAYFEEGAISVRGPMEIYIPWDNFNGLHADNKTYFSKVSKAAMTIAESTHPAWDRLSIGAKTLHGRNVYQVLGLSLDKPSAFLICWTPDGCESATTRTKQTGGTATAIAIAEKHNVPVINVANKAWVDRLLDLPCIKNKTPFTKYKAPTLF